MSSGGSSNDDLVSQFMAITGSSDAATASNYLEMSGGNVEMAIGLFMEHGGGDAGGGAAAAAGSRGGGPSSSGNAMMDADAAMAAAMAAEQQQQQQEDDIRAPDATRTMRLMDEGHVHPAAAAAAGMMMMPGGIPPGMALDPSLRMMQEMMEEQLNRPSAFASPPSAANANAGRSRRARDAVDAAAAHADDDDDDDDEQDYRYDEDDDDDDVEMQDDNDDNNQDDDDDQAAAAAPQPPRLSDMFAAPAHLIHKAGGFAGARQMAKDSKRWLLVNIQRDSEFSSHALNRDVWRNDLVENLIREGFIFWQEMDNSIEGSQFVQRYKVAEFPHVSMIDPRTGRLLWKKEGWTQESPLTAELFAEWAMDFCSRNSLDRPPVAPRPGSAAGGGSRATSAPAQLQGNNNNNSATPSEFLTEEEQLQAAVRASMEEQQQQQQQQQKPAATASLKTNGNHNGNRTSSNGDNGQQALGAAAADDEKPAAAAAVASWMQPLLETALSAEPASGGARVQIRMPNNTRMVRSFVPSDSVQQVYAFVAQSLSDEDKQDPNKKFTLSAGYPPQDLEPKLLANESIEQCSLNGTAITVRFKS